MVRQPLIFTAVLLLASSLAARAHTDNDDALAMLDGVSKRYADARSYHIEAIRESRSSSELMTSWRKEILRAEQAPGNRYRFEGRDAAGSGIVVSDGVTEWNLHRTNEVYTKRPPGTYGHPFPKMAITQDAWPEHEAFLLRSGLAMAADFAKTAHFLDEETITVGDRRIACLVVAFGPDDLRKPFPSARTTHTFWIDKVRRVIVRTRRVTDANRFSDSARDPINPIPIHSEEEDVYPVVELDEPVSNDDFVFTPPADGSLVEEFTSPFAVTTSASPASQPLKLSEMIGKPAPALTLHAADNSALPLSSLRGHPVLIDMWATWCGPCLEEMPLIDHIFQKTRSTGLVVLGLDYDENPRTALNFMKRKNYGWANYHGDPKETEFPHDGIPCHVLIDAEGKIVYYRNENDDEAGLVSAIKQLGPTFAAALDDDVKR